MCKYFNSVFACSHVFTTPSRCALSPASHGPDIDECPRFRVEREVRAEKCLGCTMRELVGEEERRAREREATR
jgi:hypothetical protein